MHPCTNTIETSIYQATQQLDLEQQQLATRLNELEKQTPVTFSSLLASSTLARQTVTECINRSAANAANTEILANAVLKLAADAGNLVSITNAHDVGSAISTQATHTHEQVNNMAAAAEQVSLMGMECSIQAAKLQFTGILEKIDSTTDTATLAELKTAFATAVAPAQELSTATNKLTQHIKEMALQWKEAAAATALLEELVVRKRATNLLVIPELADSAIKLNADAEKTVELLLVALQSAYAANSAALQTATVGVWIRTQLDHLF